MACGLPQHTRTTPTRAKRDNGSSKHQAVIEKSEIPAAYKLDTHAQKGGYCRRSGCGKLHYSKNKRTNEPANQLEIGASFPSLGEKCKPFTNTYLQTINI